jgi:hypothetical protein
VYLKIAILISLVSLTTSGQKTFSEAPKWDNKSQVIGYYGDQVSNPGIFYAYEYALLNKVKSKVKVKRGKNAVKYKTHRLELVPNVSAYIDPQAHYGFIPNVTLQYKKVNHHRWMMNVGVGFGLFANYLPEVYTIDNGLASDPAGLLNTFLAPSVNWSFGRVKNQNGKLNGLDFGIRNHFLLNYNNTVQVAPAVVLGYHF